MDYLQHVLTSFRRAPLPLILLLGVTTILGTIILFYLVLFVIAPIPRDPIPSEKTFRTIETSGKISDSKLLPCWQDVHVAQRDDPPTKGDVSGARIEVEEAEVFMSLVVPAFNEENRLEIMLTEAVDYLQQTYGDYGSEGRVKGNFMRTMAGKREKPNGNTTSLEQAATQNTSGWEVLIVSDGSTDKTIDTALRFARKLGSNLSPSIRVISLKENRGKGGAVIHGMRHVRGKYAVFADADGASKFEDLGKLVTASRKIEDEAGRGVAVGSRAHLVGSDAVVRRSFLRNLLMHSFHFLLRLLTPPATAAIQDTQCGFKLFSRPSLPYIIPYMHSEGWIFDVEMLMLAESARIPVVEVPIGWKEVKGSKLNVLWDSLGMAWGLAVLRAAWGLGVYRRQ
ncbi:dolichyl-phosphate beta-glucosyltransferase [Toensbergia leucococca]|nr:dolichyl-phosphate beta-glucosyltransferase [Toensbergia leucococca]